MVIELEKQRAARFRQDKAKEEKTGRSRHGGGGKDELGINSPLSETARNQSPL